LAAHRKAPKKPIATVILTMMRKKMALMVYIVFRKKMNVTKQLFLGIYPHEATQGAI
jgi:hypothetical protein